MARTIEEIAAQADEEAKLANEQAEKLAAEEAEKAKLEEQQRIADEQSARIEAEKGGGGESEQVETAERTETQEEVEEQQVRKSFKEVLAEVREKEEEERSLTRVKKALEHPIVKLVMEAEERGDDPKKVIAAFADVDVDSFSEKDLFIQSLKGQNLSEEEIEEAYDDFSSQKDYLKKPLLEAERNKIKNAIEEKQKQLGLAKKDLPNLTEKVTLANTSLEALLDKMPKEVDGVQLTDARKVELYKMSQKYFAAESDREGNVNVDAAFETAFAVLSRGAWKKEIIASAKSEGRRDAFEKTHNPNPNGMVTTKRPKEQSKEEKEVSEYLANMKKRQSFLVEKN